MEKDEGRDRKLSYKLALQGIISEPSLLLDYAKWKGIGLDVAFSRLDKRIRALEVELSNESK